MIIPLIVSLVFVIQQKKISKGLLYKYVPTYINIHELHFPIFFFVKNLKKKLPRQFHLVEYFHQKPGHIFQLILYFTIDQDS